MNMKTKTLNLGWLVASCFSLVAFALMSIPHAARAASPAQNRERPGTLEAVSGTWVLQQVSSVAELQRLRSSVLDPALRTPHLRGFCLRAPWRSLDGDFSLLDAGLKLAREHDLAFSVRFMAGRHTPERVFKQAKATFYVSKGNKVPAPFNPDGSPNAAFEGEYDQFVSALAGWCRTNHVRLLHLAWYGQNWAELNHGQEVRALPGYSFENWLRAHERLIDIGLKYTGEDLAVEFPFSGYGPLTEAASALADYVVKKSGPWNPLFFCQANGWGPKGDWGAPSMEVEAAFDKVWAKPICRGLQAIQPGDYDWTVMFQKLRENHSTYCEIYSPSFTQAHKKVLASEIERFSVAKPTLP